MPDGTVTPLRSRAAAAYTDTAALNDIHALLTATEPGQAALTDIALILARTGRPMTKARDIEVSTIETALGWPVALVDAGDTNVYVRQDPAGEGLLIEICTETDAEANSLTITLDGVFLRPAGPGDSPPPDPAVPTSAARSTSPSDHTVKENPDV
jgi:hypothetical protein